MKEQSMTEQTEQTVEIERQVERTEELDPEVDSQGAPGAPGDAVDPGAAPEDDDGDPSS
jgi:hypothetical protein